MAQRRDEVLIELAEVLRQLGNISKRKLQDLIREKRIGPGKISGSGRKVWMQRDIDSFLWTAMRCAATQNGDENLGSDDDDDEPEK